MSTPRSDAIRIALADDHPLLLNGLRLLLADEDALTIVGEARSGAQALRVIADQRPDVAVLDIGMPGLNGIEATKQITRDLPSTRVLILSAHEEQIYVKQALAAGARGYVLKRSLGETLVHGIRGVHTGGLYLDPAIAAFVLPTDRFGKAWSNGSGLPTQSLTDRERDVIRLIAHGFTGKEAATKLGITSKSVETYKMRASEKLNLHSRAKIVQYAIMQGWLDQLGQ